MNWKSLHTVQCIDYYHILYVKYKAGFQADLLVGFCKFPYDLQSYTHIINSVEPIA